MVSALDYPRLVVFRIRRETILLAIGAAMATFALSNVIHARRAVSASTQLAQRADSPVRDWTGELADVSTNDTVDTMPFTSASLVVPRSELALPRMPVRPLIKLRGCEGSACVARTSAPAVQRRPGGASQRPGDSESIAALAAPPSIRALPRRESSKPKPSLMTRLNPLNHLPDMSTVKRPFAYAGDAVTSWFK